MDRRTPAASGSGVRHRTTRSARRLRDHRRDTRRSPAPVDEASLGPGLQENDQSSVDFQRAYSSVPNSKRALANLVLASRTLIRLTSNAVFVPAGSARRGRCRDDPTVGQAVSAIYARNKVVADPAAAPRRSSAHATKESGLARCRASGSPASRPPRRPTSAAEDAPWLLEHDSPEVAPPTLQGRSTGRTCKSTGLVTGQNGASARETAAAVIEKLATRCCFEAGFVR